MTNTNTAATTEPGLSVEQVCFYAGAKTGMREPLNPCDRTARSIVRAYCLGLIERRERTITTPGCNMPESCKAVAMFDTWSPRTVTIITWHLVVKS